MLENLLPDWSGKLLVLILLGLAATDFVITMTLSAADAVKHAIENPYLHPFLGEAQVEVTLILLAVPALVFLSGLRGAIGMAAVVATHSTASCTARPLGGSVPRSRWITTRTARRVSA